MAQAAAFLFASVVTDPGEAARLARRVRRRAAAGLAGVAAEEEAGEAQEAATQWATEGWNGMAPVEDPWMPLFTQQTRRPKPPAAAGAAAVGDSQEASEAAAAAAPGEEAPVGGGASAPAVVVVVPMSVPAATRADPRKLPARVREVWRMAQTRYGEDGLDGAGVREVMGSAEDHDTVSILATSIARGLEAPTAASRAALAYATASADPWALLGRAEGLAAFQAMGARLASRGDVGAWAQAVTPPAAAVEARPAWMDAQSAFMWAVGGLKDFGGRPPAAWELARMPLAQFVRAATLALCTPAVDRDGVPQAPFSFRPVYACATPRCGRFLCFACARALDRVTFTNRADAHRFRCPLHSCVKCTEAGDAQSSVQCVGTTTAFHAKCLPEPGDPARPLKIAKRFVLCRRHARADAVWGYVGSAIIDRFHRGERVPGAMQGREGLEKEKAAAAAAATRRVAAAVNFPDAVAAAAAVVAAGAAAAGAAAAGAGRKRPLDAEDEDGKRARLEPDA